MKKPIDPRLQHVFDLLGIAAERIELELNPIFDSTVNEIIERLRGGLSDLAGARRTILALAAGVRDDDIAACVEIAERHHRTICFCCRTAARAK